MNKIRSVCVVVGSRANYSSIKSAMSAIQNHPLLRLRTIVAASALLDRYGSVVDLVERDGFEIDARVHMLVEGETPVTMAKSTGLGLMELPTIFEQLKPDIVLTIGDRFETMATTLAAAYMNIPLAHTMGGEVTGTIDESIRHAVTKFAHLHFPSCSDAKERIIKLGEEPRYVYQVGCPRIDLVADVLKNERELNLDNIFTEGVGGKFDIEKPFVILSQHPVTTEFGEGELQISNSLDAIRELDLPAIVLWPNADAGSEDIARGMRKFREQGHDGNFHFFKNIPTNVYIQLMNTAACIVGNSSSAIREGPYIGTPAVNIGSRQNQRQRGRNVVDVGYDKDEIKAAIAAQAQHGHYPSESIYGDGKAGGRIADILSKCDWKIQKTITY